MIISPQIKKKMYWLRQLIHFKILLTTVADPLFGRG